MPIQNQISYTFGESYSKSLKGPVYQKLSQNYVLHYFEINPFFYTFLPSATKFSTGGLGDVIAQRLCVPKRFLSRQKI